MTLTSKKLSDDQDHARAKWYVVATKSREEGKARINLERQGYGFFLPQLRLMRRNCKWEMITESLFPGYLITLLELRADEPAPICVTPSSSGEVSLRLI